MEHGRLYLLQYSVLWGILGLLAMKSAIASALQFFTSIPAGFPGISTSWILFGILIVDAVGSYAVLHHITKKMPRISAMNDQIDAFTRRLSVRVYRYLERRVERAIRPYSQFRRKKRKQKPAYLPKDAAFTKSFFSSSSAHFWAILQKPYSVASPPVSG